LNIEKIILNNLRNHINNEILPLNGFNVIYGKNGAGKTSILEAISICSLSKSFTFTPEKSLIRTGNDSFSCEVKGKTDLGMPYFSSVEYSIGQKKKIKSTFGDNILPKDLIGNIPNVILFPDSKKITSGSPIDRRNFVDRILSQISKVYYKDLLDLRKILKNRNALLNNIKKNKYTNHSELDIWNNMLINASTVITLKRQKFIDDFTLFFLNSYSMVSNSNEIASIKYEPNCGLLVSEVNTEENIKLKFTEKLNLLSKIEIIRGITLFGPQKDEFEIKINDRLAKDAASQGQHKSLLIALKFAEYEYLYSYLNEKPVFMLDDIFSELDNERVENVLGLLEQMKTQVFITLTEKDKILNMKNLNKEINFVNIVDGKIENE